MGDGLTKSDEIPSANPASSSTEHTHALLAAVARLGVLPYLVDDLKGELIIAGERRRRRILLRRTLPGVLNTRGGIDIFGRRSISAGDLSRLPAPLSDIVRRLLWVGRCRLRPRARGRGKARTRKLSLHQECTPHFSAQRSNLAIDT